MKISDLDGKDIKKYILPDDRKEIKLIDDQETVVEILSYTDSLSDENTIFNMKVLYDGQPVEITLFSDITESELFDESKVKPDPTCKDPIKNFVKYTIAHPKTRQYFLNVGGVMTRLSKFSDLDPDIIKDLSFSDIHRLTEEDYYYYLKDKNYRVKAENGIEHCISFITVFCPDISKDLEIKGLIMIYRTYDSYDFMKNTMDLKDIDIMRYRKAFTEKANVDLFF